MMSVVCATVVLAWMPFLVTVQLLELTAFLLLLVLLMMFVVSPVWVQLALVALPGVLVLCASSLLLSTLLVTVTVLLVVTAVLATPVGFVPPAQSATLRLWLHKIPCDAMMWASCCGLLLQKTR